MPYTVWGSFDAFKDRLEPTEKQKQDASTKHTGVSGYIDDYLSDDARKWTRERLKSSTESASFALVHERNDRMEWAIGRWRDALGDSFPAYG